MGWFSRKKKEPEFNDPANMSPIEAVTHLCASIQLADGQADFEERESWVGAITELFPEFSEGRADRFLNEANQALGQKTGPEKMNYLIDVLNRIKTLLSPGQIQILGPKIAELIEHKERLKVLGENARSYVEKELQFKNQAQIIIECARNC